MSSTATPAVASRRWWVWPLMVVLNAVLGYFGVIPFGFLAGALGTAVGWAEPDPTMNDGVLVVVLTGAVLSMLVLAVFAAVNYPLARIGRAPARWYWPLSVLVLLIPVVVVQIWPHLWSLIRWY
ncbi:hypothetical protein GCM10010174_47750 [Kutzneria viridogrisea]|uniref:Uncharacterized protein n=2 Tax=Kutzneria TaxID=43356 RepID=W5WDF0_9PSEU|nr:hypothetical protein [Kutzneria albida]AHH98897.1 hypothetical protein KALB_5535 [Kutzneria albida DSM 43870]MBA8923549.1 putative integral membrane protein [Kutzneria viridogrisea]